MSRHRAGRRTVPRPGHCADVLRRRPCVHSLLPSPPPTTDPAFSLTIQDSPVGPTLATGAGATLYDFVPDTPTHSACVNVGCVYQWPPLLGSSTSQVGPGVNRSLV